MTFTITGKTRDFDVTYVGFVSASVHVVEIESIQDSSTGRLIGKLTPTLNSLIQDLSQAHFYSYMTDLSWWDVENMEVRDD